LFRTADQWIGPSVWQHSSWDEAELAWALSHLGDPQKLGTVLDIGANIGTSTISFVMRHAARRVIAFEPEDLNFRLLRCNLILNGLEDYVDPRELAVSDTDGELELSLAPVNFGDHRVTSRRPASTEDRDGLTPVRGERLDSALTDEEIADVSLVWVDTQGHEAAVLAGATKLLCRPIPWVIEYWPLRLREADGLECLHDLVAENFSEVVDVRASLRAGQPVSLPAGRLPELAADLPGSESDLEHFTDLILV
jgi:FkbM family methyltransferase